LAENRTLFDVAEDIQVDVARVLKVLGDPNRIKIIELLRDGGEHCQCDIIPFIGQSQPTVSRHLNMLEENGILVSRKDGVRVLYKIADPSVLRIVELAASLA
jgi:DNA-binding transcriptional ArsR family regulator